MWLNKERDFWRTKVLLDEGESVSCDVVVYERRCGMKSYTIDLCTFNVEAENEEAATKIATEMIEEGDIEIDQILED